MAFNQYVSNAGREERIRRLMQQKYLTPYTRRLESGAQRQSREDAKRHARNQQLPSFDFASVKRCRVLHPRMS